MIYICFEMMRDEKKNNFEKRSRNSSLFKMCYVVLKANATIDVISIESFLQERDCE